MSIYTHLDLNGIINTIQSLMKRHHLHELIINDFIEKVKKVYHGETGLIDFRNVQELSSNDILDLEKLPFQLDYDSKITKEIANKVVIIKLNGGLGTSMGLDKAKTVLTVKDGMTFLDIILKQIHYLRKQTGIEIPLIFMNSFNTSQDTINYPGVKTLNENTNIPVEFIQNKVPRLAQENLMPIGDGSDPKHWCPPGHGDIYLSLKISGILDQLLNRGIEYAFISNGDNLGAIFEPSILAYMIENELDFISEVTLKTPADIKGGILFRHKITKRIELLETAQVPPENKKDFEDTTKFKDFNINNLWINLKSLNQLLETEPLDLHLIVNPKEVDGIPVYQLESAMGAAIGKFKKTRVIRVPRKRFAPVKKCNDLLVRRSDAYILNEKFALLPNPELKQEPVVILSKDYDKIKDFENYFQKIPSLLNCTQLVIQGKYIFDIPVKITGKVELKNESNAPLYISNVIKEQKIKGLSSI
ncbi:MAG: nucleotide glucose-1-phosphate uridylyl transferase [Leptospiraceae bacterium]|nr:MAG: nucleotide glucose-1-phosphate uridylyl transferase [Leptospiraceae bacterium]